MKFVNMEYKNKYIDVAIEVYERVLPELKDARAGEYKINDGFRLLLQEYQTKVFNDDAQIEWHRKNHDVFIFVDGEELATGMEKGAENFDNDEFDEDKDVGFTSIVPYKQLPFFKFGKNDVLHFEPNDLHISQIAIDDKPEKVKKCCFKIVDGYECKVSSDEILALRMSLVKGKTTEYENNYNIASKIVNKNIQNVLLNKLHR